MPLVEQVMTALMAALATVPGTKLVERNRTSMVPEGMTPALVAFDGDLDGMTDRPVAVSRGRDPYFQMTLEPMVWGYVEAPDSQVGTRRNQLFSATVKAIWTNAALRKLLAENGGGIALRDAAFPPPATAPDTAAAAFVVRLGLSFDFDPANP